MLELELVLVLVDELPVLVPVGLRPAGEECASPLATFLFWCYS